MIDCASIETLHASAVVTRAGVAVLCARSGTGKSTLASHLHARGYCAWADDAVVWAPAAGSAITLPSMYDERARELAVVFVLDRVDASEPHPDVAVRVVSGAAALTSVLTHAHPCDSDDLPRRRAFVASYAHLADVVPVVCVTFRPDLSKLPALGDALEGLFADLTSSSSRRAM